MIKDDGKRAKEKFRIKKGENKKKRMKKSENKKGENDCFVFHMVWANKNDLSTWSHDRTRMISRSIYWVVREKNVKYTQKTTQIRLCLVLFSICFWFMRRKEQNLLCFLIWFSFTSTLKSFFVIRSFLCFIFLIRLTPFLI